MRRRAHGFDWDEFPVIGGQGSLHSLESQTQEPRLWFAKSVSKSAAGALHRSDETAVHPIGFHIPQRLARD